jgi:CubicO group peptidase (beta-lactamase class C family)
MHVLLLATLLQTGEIDRAVRLEMRVERIAGLSIGIVRNGRTLFERGYGTADFGRGTAARGDTVYRIGSLTKPFTAYAIEQLATQGKLALNDPVAKYVAVPWAGVTVEDLLLHRSGIPSYSDLRTLNERSEYSPQALVDAVAGMPLQFVPGTQFAYSNTNYVLLGEIVARVTNETYPEYLQTAVLQPLRLAATRYGDRAEQARGYARNTLRTPVVPSSVSYGYAAAGMSSNVPDLLRWLASAREPYYGYFSAQMYGHAVRYATGTVPGYSSYEALFPQSGDRMVILTNADTLDLVPLAEDVLLALEPPAPEYRVRALIEQLQAATLVRATLTPRYNAMLGEVQLRAWQVQLAPLGAVQNIERTGSTSGNGCTEERFRARFTTGAGISISICLTPSGAIDAIAIAQP